MVRSSTVVAGVAGGALAAAGAWTLYQRRTTENVQYTVVARVDDVELRRYPEQALVETVAPPQNAVFGWLYRYISGANDGGEKLSRAAPVEVGDSGTSIEMTAPVEVERLGRKIPMTAPVETGRDRDGDEVRMAFYLPPESDADAAPRPTDDDVAVVEVPERTLAVRRFSWWPTDARVDRETERLLETLKTAGVPLAGEPFLMGTTLPGRSRSFVATRSPWKWRGTADPDRVPRGVAPGAGVPLAGDSGSDRIHAQLVRGSPVEARLRLAGAGTVQRSDRIGGVGRRNVWTSSVRPSGSSAKNW